MKHWRKKVGLGFILSLTLLLLVGCSTGTQLGYRFLDDLMRWELNDYVSLQGALSNETDAALDAFHAWHRQDQLPQYVAFLALQKPLLAREQITTAQLQQGYDRAMMFWKASTQRLVPDMAQLLSQLDEEQLRQLQQNMDNKTAEYERKRIKPSLAKRKKERHKRMRESLEKWIGSLNDAQEKRLQQWTDAISYDTTDRMHQRRLLRQRFDDSLALQAKPKQLEQQLAQLLVSPEQRWTPAYRQYVYFNRQQVYDLLIDLHASLTAAQKKKLLDKVDGYQRDFAKLSNAG